MAAVCAAGLDPMMQTLVVSFSAIVERCLRTQGRLCGAGLGCMC